MKSNEPMLSYSYPGVPEYEERIKVAGYMLTLGFKRKEIEKIDCLGPEYKLARDAMRYQVIKSKAP